MTLLERLIDSGIGADRASDYIRTEWCRVDGLIVTDPDQDVSGRIVLAPPSVTEHT